MHGIFAYRQPHMGYLQSEEHCPWRTMLCSERRCPSKAELYSIWVDLSTMSWVSALLTVQGFSYVTDMCSLTYNTHEHWRITSKTRAIQLELRQLFALVAARGRSTYRISKGVHGLRPYAAHGRHAWLHRRRRGVSYAYRERILCIRRDTYPARILCVSCPIRI